MTDEALAEAVVNGLIDPVVRRVMNYDFNTIAMDTMLALSCGHVQALSDHHSASAVHGAAYSYFVVCRQCTYS